MFVCVCGGDVCVGGCVCVWVGMCVCVCVCDARKRVCDKKAAEPLKLTDGYSQALTLVIPGNTRRQLSLYH